MKSKTRDHNGAKCGSEKQMKERKSTKRVSDPNQKMRKRSKSRERGRKNEKKLSKRSERKSRSKSRDRDLETLAKKQRKSQSQRSRDSSPRSEKEQRARRPSKDRDVMPFDEARDKSKKQDIELKAAELRLKASSSEVSLLEMADFARDLPLIDLEQPSVGDSSSKHLNQISIYEQSDAQTIRRKSSKETTKGSPIDTLKYRLRCVLKCLLHFRTLKAFQCICAIYVCIMTFKGGLMDPETGLVVDKESEERTEAGLILVNGRERPIVAESDLQVLLILVARLSAWFMYPTLSFVYISKLRATQSFLEKSPIAIHMYKDSHELHVYCGWTILYCSLIHGASHIIRWALQGNLNLMVDHISGITGILILSSCLLICVPMTLLKKRIRYEIRKNLHYLFLLFALALCFHSPPSAVPNGGFSAYVFGTILVWYFVDFLYCFFFMTEKIETTKFSVVPTGVKMTMKVSERFQKMGNQGGICYVCLPWISKNQWHAFSLFENPKNPLTEREIFIQKTGDWTSTVHDTLQRETVRPAWVQGPYSSPYANADAYDNQILVASGIGITPALSVIRAHKETRRLNLIWMVRDENLLKFFLQHLYLDHNGWNLVFYTGKKKLSGIDAGIMSNSKVCIIQGRPDLSTVIPNIMFGIESGLGLPERYAAMEKLTASEMIAERFGASQGLNGTDALEDIAVYASELGFTLSFETVTTEIQLLENRNLDGSYTTCQETIMTHMDIGFRPWDDHDGAKNYVKDLDKNLVLPRWGIFYCGGAKVVEEELRKISDEYKICIHVESFAW